MQALRPRGLCAFVHIAQRPGFCTLRTRLAKDGAVWPVPALTSSEAEELYSRLLAETSGLTSRDFKRSDLLYYKAHLMFSAVDSLSRHPTIIKAAQEALGSKDVLLWDSSVPWKPPASDGMDAGSGFFPWHQDGT